MELDDEPTESEVAAMATLLERNRQALAWRCEQPYDGVLGVLPAWVPQWHRDDFTRTRDRLLDEQMYGERMMPQQIHRWISAYAAAGEGVDGGWPDERGDEIGRLANFRYAVSLGEKKGLELLGGADAVRGRKSVISGCAGAEITNGLPGEIAARWADYQAAMNQLALDKPDLSRDRRADFVGKSFGVSKKTILRRTSES